MEKKTIYTDNPVWQYLFFAVGAMLLLHSAACVPVEDRKAPSGDTGHRPVDDVSTQHYTAILDGLDKSYVVVAEQEDGYRSDILAFFQVDKEQFARDSVLYRQAVQDFFAAEKNIIPYLLQFEHDTLTCAWLGWEHPFSSKLDFFSLYRQHRQIAALVLVYNYLGQTRPVIYEKYRVVVPNTLSCEPHAAYVDYHPFKQWYERYRSLPLEALREKFRSDSPPDIVIQCR